ncbi:methyltransferase domain-containing protein [Nocardioides sp.]|uniref:methyltransferase domain-containing protein n=1 Tax=Nocardioides sp. TaxID=35761 RepID=UPI0027340CC4|nr:methyltransferase domain-containing protein [Nocardioides sp.]MDP3893964.1 methyltransferase [Nocardioides sp.]
MMRFGHLDIAFDQRVLAPRPWTVHQSRWAAELLGETNDGGILELCTGAGQIGLLTAALSGRPLVAVDVCPVACCFARHNAERAGLADRVEVREAPIDSCADPDERFMMVVADPPWVPSRKVGGYPADPVRAIDGGEDGLGLARACVETIRRHLHRDGAAVLQLGTLLQADVMTGELAGEDLHVSEVRNRPGRGVLLQLRFASQRNR